MTDRIYHITSQAVWQQAYPTGTYTPETFATEHFIHCSYPHQLLGVAQAKFHGQTDLVLLAVDRLKLTCQVVDENLTGGTDLFPHIYGPIPVRAVEAVIPFPCQADGAFTLPAALRT